MTGTLVTGQQPPELLPTELSQDVQALAPRSLSPSPDKITIAAPEFLQIAYKPPLLPLLIQPEIQNLLHRLRSVFPAKKVTNLTLVKDTPSLNPVSRRSSDLNPNLNTNGGIDHKKVQRLRSQLISDGSLVLARYGSTRNSGLPILQFGTTGISVRVLQRLLASNGYPIRIDGEFGALTEAAVKAFQSQREIITDGIVGPITWSELTENNTFQSMFD